MTPLMAIMIGVWCGAVGAIACWTILVLYAIIGTGVSTLIRKIMDW